MELEQTSDILSSLWHSLRFTKNHPVDHPDVEVTEPHSTNTEAQGGLYDWRTIYIYSEFDPTTDEVIDILCHEHMHHLLYKLEGFSTCRDLDTLVQDDVDRMVHNLPDYHCGVWEWQQLSVQVEKK